MQIQFEERPPLFPVAPISIPSRRSLNKVCSCSFRRGRAARHGEGREEEEAKGDKRKERVERRIEREGGRGQLRRRRRRSREEAAERERKAQRERRGGERIHIHSQCKSERPREKEEKEEEEEERGQQHSRKNISASTRKKSGGKKTGRDISVQKGEEEVGRSATTQLAQK